MLKHGHAASKTSKHNQQPRRQRHGAAVKRQAARDVIGLRVCGGEIQPRLIRDMVVIQARALEANVQRPRKGRFRPSSIGGSMIGRIAPHHPQAGARAV